MVSKHNDLRFHYALKRVAKVNRFRNVPRWPTWKDIQVSVSCFNDNIQHESGAQAETKAHCSPLHCPRSVPPPQRFIELASRLVSSPTQARWLADEGANPAHSCLAPTFSLCTRELIKIKNKYR